MRNPLMVPWLKGGVGRAQSQGKTRGHLAAAVKMLALTHLSCSVHHRRYWTANGPYDALFLKNGQAPWMLESTPPNLNC